MTTTLEFAVLVRLMDDRSTAFRAAVASAPSLDVQVPTCPEWTLFDLVHHLGEGRRRWDAIVAAGPADAPPAKPALECAPAAPDDRAACWPGWPHRRSTCWTRCGRPARIAVAGPGGMPAVAADVRCRGTAPAPGGRGAHLLRPGHRRRAAAAAGRGGTRRCRRCPVHLLNNNKRLAAQARCPWGTRRPLEVGRRQARHLSCAPAALRPFSPAVRRGYGSRQDRLRGRSARTPRHEARAGS